MTTWLCCALCGVLATLYGILTQDLPATAVGVSWAVAWGIVGASQANGRMLQGLLSAMNTPLETPRPAAPAWAFDRLGAADAGQPMTTFASTIPSHTRGTARTTAYGRARLTATGTAPAGPAMVEQEWRQPRGAQTTGADVAVPALQALITAGATAICVAFVVWRLGGDVLTWAGGDVLTWAGGAFVVGLLGAWLWRLGIASQLLWLVEKITHRDLDHDGAEGEPDDSHTLTMNAPAARQEARQHERRRERAERLGDLLHFTQRCATVGTSERALGIRPGTDERTRYQARRDLLIQLGIARWKDPARPQAGWRLTVDAETATELLRKHVMDVN